MRIRRFNEDIDLNNDFESLKDDIMEMITNSVNTSNIDVISEFITSYINEPDNTFIEGFVNDSDVYEFYLKYINDIDKILNDINYFENSPESKGTLGLYDYLVKGTRDAVKQIFIELEKEY